MDTRVADVQKFLVFSTGVVRFGIRTACFSVGLVLMLAGCASMSEKECLTVNWVDQGYRDGRQGYPLSRVEEHREACAKVGVVPEVMPYRRGHAQGVLEYCTPENAISEGRAGRPYRNACPAVLESEFLAHHESGMRVYHAQQRLDTLNRQSQQLQRTLDKEKNETRQRRLRTELRDMDRRLRDARDELHHEQRRLSF